MIQNDGPKMGRIPQGFALSLAALLLAGCAQTSLSDIGTPPPPAPQASTADYKALGNEADWQLTISGNKMEFVGNYGELRIEDAHIGAVVQGRHTRYVGPRLTVTVEEKRCDDTMVERSYRDTVMVVSDGRNLRGCGGPILPPAQLDGTSWEIVAVNGAALLPDGNSRISFADGRMSGTAGCNNFSGGFTASNASLRFAPLALTRKACAPALMAQERSAVDILGKVVRHEFTPDGRLHLHGAEGDNLTLRQTF